MMGAQEVAVEIVKTVSDDLDERIMQTVWDFGSECDKRGVAPFLFHISLCTSLLTLAYSAHCSRGDGDEAFVDQARKCTKKSS